MLLPLPPCAYVSTKGNLNSSICIILEKYNQTELELLTKMLLAININIDNTYQILFTYKNNQKPNQVLNTLQDKPRYKAIIPFGANALQECLPFNTQYDHIRHICYKLNGNPVIPVDHPADIIKNLDLKKRSWLSLQKIQNLL